MVTDKAAEAEAFRAAIAALTAAPSLADIALALGCSRATVNQARLPREATGARNPPTGWRTGLAGLADQRIEVLAGLADRLVAEA